MNKEKQRIKIAEACGCKLDRDENGFWVFLNPNQLPKRVAKHHTEEQAWLLCCCHYLEDLNAMHSAEKVLDKNQMNIYVHLIVRDSRCKLGISEYESHDRSTFIVHATARQRAESFLKTLGLWEKEATNE